jgi:hypothetical protein
MRAPGTLIRTMAAGVLAALVGLALSASLALAKGESAGLITLAAPIPRDAEPRSTLTVEFTATMTDAQGNATPLRGSPVVLRLIGPDGTSTEALAAERGTPGSYRLTIEVPASGIDAAIFGLRGSSVAADGTSTLQDIPFDVNGLLFTTAAHPAPAAPAANPGSTTTTPPASTEPPLLPAAILGLVLGAMALVLVLLVDRRRSLRSA